MGFEGPIDLNHLAIHAAMKLGKIKDIEACYEKVLLLANYWLKKVREKGN